MNLSTKMMNVAAEVKEAATTAAKRAPSWPQENDVRRFLVRRLVTAHPVMLKRINTPAA